MNAYDCVKKARACAMVMKRTDPSIELIGCGQNGWSEWDEIVLGGLAEVVDYHSIHLHTGSPDHHSTLVQAHQGAPAWSGGVRGLPLHPPLHRQSRPLLDRVPVAPGRAGCTDLRRAHRARP